MDHVIRYQDTPGIKMIVVLGEVGLNIVESCLSYILKYLSAYIFMELNFTPDKPDWWYRGVQDLPGGKGRQDNQACGVLVHWNLCYDVCFRGWFVFNTLVQMLFFWK